MNIRKRAKELLDEGTRVKLSEKDFRAIGALGADMTHGPDTLKWLNDVYVFADNLPEKYALKQEIKNEYHLHKRKAYVVSNMIAFLSTIVADDSLGSIDDASKERNGIMTKKEHEYLDIIEKRFEKSKTAQFSDDEVQRMQDVLNLLVARGVLRDMEVDIVNIYARIGDFAVFREWLEDQEQEAQIAQASMSKPDRKKYDVFLSHANKDKLEYVNELFDAISALDINIFYDKKALKWGDNWKLKILNGTAASEFAIIVISENFFGREWTEIELNEFLKRQNESGQKIILPLLHNITLDRFKEKYPLLADLHVITTEEYSTVEITLLLANELINRYR